MKIKGLKGLVIGLILMSLMLTGTAFAADHLGILTSEYANTPSEEEAMKKLEPKSFEELIGEINILGDKVDMSSLIFHAAALKEKAASIPNEQLQAEILNENNSNNTRAILIQISRHLGNTVDNEVLKSMLQQDNIDF